MPNILEQFFLKKRLVLVADHLSYIRRNLNHPRYDIIQIDNSSFEANYEFLASYINKQHLQRRIENPNCTGLLATEKGTSRPVGFYWALHATDQILWHDNFPVPCKSALVFNSYVLKEDRQHGIYTLLKGALYNHMFDTKKCDRVFTVVESSNKPSVIANYKFGLELAATNYLVKLAGKNVFSIYKNSTKHSLYFVPAYAKVNVA